jgi:hypothetical protein
VKLVLGSIIVASLVRVGFPLLGLRHRTAPYRIRGLWATMDSAPTPRPVQTSAFLALAPELLEQIVLNCDPLDVHRLAQTCTWMHGIVYASFKDHLWRKFYLCLFDDPRLRWPNIAYDWRDNLQRRINARENLKNSLLNSSAISDVAFDRMLWTLLDIIDGTAPASEPEPSRSSSWISEQLEPLTEDAGWRLPTWMGFTQCLLGGSQMRSRLLVYYGLQSEGLSPATRTCARIAVYYCHRHLGAANFGPFIPDWNWRVNWFLLDQTMIVILMNLEERTDMLPPDHHPPKGLETTRPWFWSPRGEDWAGIAGTWRHVRLPRRARRSLADPCERRRVACFMDGGVGFH